jgi:hypothetical protein
MYFGWDTYMALTGKVGGSTRALWDKLSFQTAETATQTKKAAEGFAKDAGTAVSTLSRSKYNKPRSGSSEFFWVSFSDLYFQSHRMGYL